jgi:hypothetical protein
MVYLADCQIPTWTNSGEEGELIFRTHALRAGLEQLVLHEDQLLNAIILRKSMEIIESKLTSRRVPPGTVHRQQPLNM